MNNQVKIVLQKYCIEELNLNSPLPKKNHNLSLRAELEVQNKIELSKENENKEFWVSIHSLIRVPEVPNYTISCRLTGEFKFLGEYSREEKNYLMTRTAPTALFGSIREIISSLSAKTPYFPIILPVFDFPGNEQ